MRLGTNAQPRPLGPGLVRAGLVGAATYAQAQSAGIMRQPKHTPRQAHQRWVSKWRRRGTMQYTTQFVEYFLPLALLFIEFYAIN